MKIKNLKIEKEIPINAELTFEDEMDMQRPLLHARQFPAEPIFDEDDELSGVNMPPDDWEVVLRAMLELRKMAKPTDRIVTRFHASEDRKTGAIEIGIVHGN